MFIEQSGTVVTSASDLAAYASCEFAFLRRLDAKLKRVAAVEEELDQLGGKVIHLGNVHERAVLEKYRADGLVVVEFEAGDVEGAPDAAAATRAALEQGAGLVYQGTFLSDGFLGYADFLVRMPGGAYQVQDTKLARTAKVTALLQLAAYADQLDRIGIDVDPEVVLILGDGRRSVHQLADVMPVFRNRWAAMRSAVDERLAAGAAVVWGADGHIACGRCAWCEPEVIASDDLFQVAGIRGSQRAAGIMTLTELANSAVDKIDRMTKGGLAGLRAQAVQQMQPADGDGAPTFVVHQPVALAALPESSPGDIFFDFEGDPLYSEAATEADETLWGLDYLFGFVNAAGDFTSYFAHDLAQEKQALVDFLHDVSARRAQHPDLHIYHYAAYERTHLLSLAARHHYGEALVDALLRDGVLVDLYPIVRRALRVGDRSYSLKVVEKIFRGEKRTAAVTNAADSIAEYWRYRELAAQGQTAEAEAVLGQIASYNEDDCVSTLQLRDWLSDLAADASVALGAPAEEEEAEAAEESPLSIGLRALAGNPLDPDRTADERAYGLAAAAVDYHRRERKKYWQEHYTRLADLLDDWPDARDIFLIEEAEVLVDWRIEGKWRSPRRQLHLTGSWTPASRLTLDDGRFAVFEFTPGLDFGFGSGRYPRSRPAHARTFLLAVSDTEVVLEEGSDPELGTHAELPIALTPSKPPGTAELEAAIQEWGEGLLRAHPSWPSDAVADVLRRNPPRILGGRLSEVTDGDTVAALVDSLLTLDESYVAVQGPPGTGKTYKGGHVIAQLALDHGWRIGVVSQSHTTVQNMLEAVARAGVPRDRIAKRPKTGTDAEPGGRVVGGTAWAFANASQVGRRQLDLLVIDEAGQYSLGMTIAAAVSARRLLLLGDPQQLPQVSQGAHPEPVNESALGFVSEGHRVLPPELGYFLAETRRMSAELTAAVSHLSYEDDLRAHPVTADRRLDSVEPGVHPVPVVHADSTTSSRAEAERVVELVQRLVGTPWTDPHANPPRASDPLHDSDIIVVSPYNAQVELLRERLDAAGFTGTAAGTVDRFQGQEKVIAIVSMSASSADDIPRGMEFLILRNRLNVAISRAQWAAYLVHSPALVDHLPHTPDGVARLSGFLGLIEQ